MSDFETLSDVTVREITIERTSWKDLDACLDYALELAQRQGENVRVKFTFDDRDFIVCRDSELELLKRDYWRNHWRERHDGVPIVGPHPEPNSTELDEQIARELQDLSTSDD